MRCCKEEKGADVEMCCKQTNYRTNMNGGMGGGIYGLAFVGTLVYYIQVADGFWMGCLGVLKALVWPAMLIHEVFSRLSM